MKKIMVFWMLLIGIITLSGCVKTSNVEPISFILKGDVVLEITSLETYTDLGFTATKGDLDLSSYVTTTGLVTEGTIGIYYIEYVLTYDGTVSSLIRAITIVPAYAADDPDRILYDGTCENVEIHYIDLNAMGDSANHGESLNNVLFSLPVMVYVVPLLTRTIFPFTPVAYILSVCENNLLIASCCGIEY